jgi:hypothetical protein
MFQWAVTVTVRLNISRGQAYDGLFSRLSSMVQGPVWLCSSVAHHISKKRALPWITYIFISKLTVQYSDGGRTKKTKLNFMVWVRERTIPTERPDGGRTSFQNIGFSFFFPFHFIYFISINHYTRYRTSQFITVFEFLVDDNDNNDRPSDMEVSCEYIE